MNKYFLKIVRVFREAFGMYKKVYFNDFTRVDPVSSVFGCDRGTPIDRYYIENFLDENRHFIKGRIIEIAEDRYSRLFANHDAQEKPIFDTLHFDGTEGETTIIGDLSVPSTLPENRYDCFICTQTYNFIFDVRKSIEGTYTLLKKGGVVLATVSGISQISRHDMDRWGDFWRFTDKSMTMLFEQAGFSKIEVVTMGNSLASTALLQGIAVEDLPNKELLDIVDKDYQMTIGIKAVK